MRDLHQVVTKNEKCFTNFIPEITNSIALLAL